jgi:hypothetical protein
LVQLGVAVPPKEPFSDYLYASSTSALTRAHFEGLTNYLGRFVDIRPGSLVVDLASNDGSPLNIVQTASPALEASAYETQQHRITLIEVGRALAAGATAVAGRDPTIFTCCHVPSQQPSGYLVRPP